MLSVIHYQTPIKITLKVHLVIFLQSQSIVTDLFHHFIYSTTYLWVSRLYSFLG